MVIKNKVVITGASSGIGLEFGNTLVKLGWKITNISRTPSIFNNIKMNLSSIDCINDFIKVIKNEKPNMIIFNAGILYDKWLGDYTSQEIINMSNLNCIIPSLLLNKLINSKIKLVFVSSIAAYMTPVTQAYYGASKSYLSKIVRAAQVEQLYKSKKTNVIEVIFGKFLATNINPQIKNNDNLNHSILKKEVSVVVEKIINEEITIWSHGEFYKKIADRFCKNPLDEGLKSIKYRLGKTINN